MTAFALPATLATGAPKAAARLDGRRFAVASLLMAAAATTQDNTMALVRDWPWLEASGFTLISVAKYALGFWVVAWLAQRTEGRLARRAAVALFVALVPVLSGANAVLNQLANDLMARWFVSFAATRGDERFLPATWLYGSLGGLFFAYCLIVQRSLRVRDQLARAELARARTTIDLAQAQGDAMAARIDPAFMLRALTALRTAYDRGDGRADGLLDALVAFLRLAMPAVSSGRSTLLAELALLRAHAQLVALIEPGRRLCSVDAESPACDLPFPPLVLVPLVEAAAVRSAVAPHVSLTREGRRLKLAVQAPGGRFDDELLQPLDRALRRLYPGEPVPFTTTEGCLTLRLPLSPGESEKEIDDARTTIA